MFVSLGLDSGLEQLRESVVSRWSAAVLVGNLGDGVSTLTFLHLDLAEELNPVMLAAYQASPLWFMAIKLTLVHLSLLLLYLNRHVPAARFGEAFGGVLYTVLLGWHLVCWSNV